MEGLSKIVRKGTTPVSTLSRAKLEHFRREIDIRHTGYRDPLRIKRLNTLSKRIVSVSPGSKKSDQRNSC